jgi:hypothetical protein
VADRLIGELHRQPLALRGHDVSLEASIGVALAAEPVEADTFIAEAELALRRAKARERHPSGVSIFLEEVHATEGAAVGRTRGLSKTELEAVREEIDRGVAAGLCLSEMEDLLAARDLAEEIRDAAWLYAWASLERKEERRRAGGPG